MHRIASSVVLIALLSACSSVTPDAGEEAVLTYKPIIFGHGGVDPKPVKTGRTFVAWTTDHVIVNMQPKTHGVEFDDLMSKEGVPLDFHAMIRLQITNSVTLIENFGPKWFENNIAPEFATQVRDAVKRHGMNETAISTVAVAVIDSTIEANMKAYIASIKIPVLLQAVTVGRANPPDAIKTQRIETATQEQRINTELQRKLAEDSRRAAEASRAIADNAYRNAMSLSPEQFLRLEDIKMKREVCAKSACSFITGASVIPTVRP